MDKDWKQGIDALIRRMALKDEQALGLLIQNTGDHVLGLIHKNAPGLPEEEVDAIYNQVYAKAWLKAAEYRGESHHDNPPDQTGWQWISKITRNSLRDYGRKRKRRLSWEILEVDMRIDPDGEDEDSSYDAPLDRIPDGNFPVEDRIAEEQGLEGFKELLTEGERLIIERLIDGYSQSEIAKDLDVSPPAISQKKRALKEKASSYFKPKDRTAP